MAVTDDTHGVCLEWRNKLEEQGDYVRFFKQFCHGSATIRLPQMNAVLKSLGMSPSPITQHLFRKLDLQGTGNCFIDDIVKEIRREGEDWQRRAAPASQQQCGYMKGRLEQESGLNDALQIPKQPQFSGHNAAPHPGNPSGASTSPASTARSYGHFMAGGGENDFIRTQRHNDGDDASRTQRYENSAYPGGSLNRMASRRVGQETPVRRASNDTPVRGMRRQSSEGSIVGNRPPIRGGMRGGGSGGGGPSLAHRGSFLRSSPSSYNGDSPMSGSTAPPQKGADLDDLGQVIELDVGQMVLDTLRKVLIQRAGSAGVAAFGLQFKLMDRSQDGLISKNELKIAASRFGLKVSDKDCALVLSTIGKSGGANYQDFLSALQGPLNKRRRKLIDMAFQVMDKTGNGVITREDLTNYDMSYDPDVKQGIMTGEEALDNLLEHFDTNHDGKVTLDDFLQYYKGVSASIEDDDYFELMIRNAWHIPGGQGWCANTSNIRLLVTFAGGDQKVVCIDDDLGLDWKNRAAVMDKLKRQGIKNVVSAAIELGDAFEGITGLYGN